MTEVDHRVLARRAHEEAAIELRETVDDPLERRLVAAGHPDQLGQPPRPADAAALGVDLGDRAEQILGDFARCPGARPRPP